MLTLYKFLGYLLLPMPAGLLLSALALVLLRPRSGTTVALALLALIWLSATPVVGRKLLRLVEDRIASLAMADLPPADAVVVLSGGFPDRELCGLRLLQQGKAPVVLFSGRSSELNTDRLNDLIQLAHLSPKQVMREQTSRTTREGGEALAAIARTRGWQSVLLVSHAYHQRRALQSYRSPDLEVIPAICPELSLPSREALRHRPTDQKLLDLLPGPDGLRYTNLALRELLGAALVGPAAGNAPQPDSDS